ncbi:MAG: alpha-1,2-fucosyltransferase [Ferruginibacter sp.]
MIIVKIIGGLGNQLFQYAAAKALAEHHHTQVKADISDFENYTLRNFDLDYFNTSISIATNEEIQRCKAFTSVQRVKARLTPYPKKHFYKQPSFAFDSNFFSLQSNVYLQGYFQSEKYFSSIEKIIQQEFTLKQKLSPEVNQLSQELKNVSSVALHIRRGDYRNVEAAEVHGVVPITYYQEAIRFIKNKFNDVRFYIFSDDPGLAKKELNLTEAKIISGIYTKNHFEDLFLMSQCKHNIIANSSFSWWGAWLNANPDKIIIAPKNWFNKGPEDTEDLLPESWIKL